MPKAKKGYSHKDVESEAQDFWDTNEVFSVTEDPNKEKFYCLSMSPTPVDLLTWAMSETTL